MTSDEFAKQREEIVRIGNLAVKQAQLENLKMGIPNVYSKNGKIYYQLPDLSITTDSPFISESNR